MIFAGEEHLALEAAQALLPSALCPLPAALCLPPAALCLLPAIFRARARNSAARTSLCREGYYYLGVLVFVLCASMLRQVNLLLILAGMLIGPVVFNWRLVVTSLRGLQVRRKTPHGICAGDLLVVNLELENSRKRSASWAVVAEDRIEREGDEGQPRLQPAVFFGHVPAGKIRGEVYRARLVRRGRYRLGPVQVSTRFPFGLIRRTVTLEQYDTLLVYPRLGRLMRAWARRHHQSFEGASRRERRDSRVSGEFYGVREWRPGDNRRWVHWRSSARHGQLVVRQFEQHRNRDMALLLDLWRPASPREEDLENVELAVSFAATVINDLCRKGGSDLLLGITADAPVCLAGPASMVLLQDAMEALAVAEACDEDRLPALLERVARQLDAASDVVLVTTRPIEVNDPRFAALSQDPARRLLARRIRVINAADARLAEYFLAQ